MRRILFAVVVILLILGGVYFATSTSDAISIARTTAVYWYKDLQSPDSPTNLMLGSSSVRRLDSDKYLQCGKWTNRGIGSSTIPDIETYLKYSLSDIKPSNILIYGGENDLQKKDDKTGVFPRYVTLLDNLSNRFPSALIHIVAIKPSMQRQDNWNYFESVNASLKAFTETRSHLFFHEPLWLDVYKTGKDREKNPWFLEDGVHLSHTGYVAFTDPVNTKCVSR